MLATALLALLAGSVAGHEHSRRLLARPMPPDAIAKGQVCRNTVAGPWLYTDDKGLLCKRGDMDFSTGCCKAGDKHSCSSCAPKDSCCADYEGCVSCCLAPDNRPEEALKTHPLVPNKPHTKGEWRDAFDFCAGVCRTHSRSTSHENAYVGARHHCFRYLGTPLLQDPLPADALKGVAVVLGGVGQSCDAACKAAQLGACSEPHLRRVNTCDQLRLHSACEAGCVEEAHAEYLPGYVQVEAPKQARPALCQASKGEGSCGASGQNIRRLCACKTPGAE